MFLFRAYKVAHKLFSNTMKTLFRYYLPFSHKTKQCYVSRTECCYDCLPVNLGVQRDGVTCFLIIIIYNLDKTNDGGLTAKM